MVSRGVIQDRKLAGVALRQLLRGAAAGAGRIVPRFGKLNPQKLLIAPQDIRTSDPTIASDIYAGQIKLAGKVLETHGASPFELESPSQAFEMELHGFGWLRHFRAADTAVIRTHGRVLVADWIKGKHHRRTALARHPDVTARRVISWLGQAPLLLEGADAAFYNQFVQSVSAEAHRLKTLARSAPPTEQRLLIQIALTHFAVSSSESDAHIKQEALRLCDLLDEQILSDGGHVTRSPAVVLGLLLDLLPLKLAFLWRRIQTPQPIVSAIDRMLPMMRMMRHSDGSLALFHGMGATRADIVAAVLAQDDALAPAPLNAPYAGYQRVQHGKSVLICDTGKPPLPPLAHHVHGAPSAFEFSVDGGRLVVNCGAPPSHRPEMRAVSRLTAAHSTLIFDDRPIGHFTRSPWMNALVGDQYSSGAKSVKYARGEKEGGTLLSIEHDGYGASHGLLHQRKLALSSDGLLLEGEDALLPLKGAAVGPYLLRFHIHPLVRMTPSAHADEITLTLPNGKSWIFAAHGGRVTIEESIFLASPDGFRRCEQIVVTAELAASASIQWAFQKV